MKTKLIAEFGVNYNSDEDIIKMLDKCQELKIKFAKLQLFTKDMVPTELQHCYIDEKRAKKIYVAGEKRDIEVFFSVMYPDAIDICETIGIKYYKLRYMDRNNLILYRKLKKIKDKIIFVSCQNPKDTIFWNMKKHQGNIDFLYCVPKYPAKLKDYIDGWWKPDLKLVWGISDHTPDLELFKKANETAWCEYFEMHVCLDPKTAYEGDWSKSFDMIKEVL